MRFHVISNKVLSFIEKLLISGTIYEKWQKKLGRGSWTLEKEIEMNKTNGDEKIRR